MTDKQIIIDGVDVSGCKHYKNRTCIADYCLTDMPFDEAKCELNSNCYYKQLKHKEQECEELKKQACGLRPELKSMIDKICCKYNVETKNYHEKIIEIINNLDKYKQALDEIKYQVTELFLGVENKDRAYCEKILDIINKAKE